MMTYVTSTGILLTYVRAWAADVPVSVWTILTPYAFFVYGQAHFVYSGRVPAGNFGVKAMPKRFITRIELTVPTRTKLTDVSHSNGMTQVAVLSRIVQWFAAQPETIQAAILGRYPAEIEPDVARMLLERMANAQKK